MQEEDAKTIYGHYRNLYQIEDAFRINKSDLKIRPIFHWTPERIKAHIAISYMAYSCYKAVEYIVNRKEKVYSHRAIRDHLLTAEAYILEERVTGFRFFTPFKVSKEVKHIYRAMGLVPEESTYRIA
jgi:transposase